MLLLKSLSLASLSTAARLIASLATFAVVARVLGPLPFGVLMLFMSAATLLSIASNFGLVTYLMREIGRNPAQASEAFSGVLCAKMIATAGVICCGVLALPLMDAHNRWLFILVLGAMLAEAMSELLNAGFRASARFDVEARLAFVAAIVNSLLVASVAWLTASLEAIAVAYLVSRIIVSLLTWWRLVQVIGPIKPSGWRNGFGLLSNVTSYAFDSGLTSMFGQVDSFVLNHFAGPAAVGVHQAGMRIFMAGSQAAPVLTNVFLPRAAAAHAQNDTLARTESSRMQLAFVGVGAMIGLLMAVLGGELIPLIFGPGFAPLVSLMPWFGFLFAVRFAAAAWGIVLTAQGLQSYRVAASSIHWLAVGLAAFLWVPDFGNIGWLFALIAGNGLLFGLYMARVVGMNSADFRTLLLTASVWLAFLPLLVWP